MQVDRWLTSGTVKLKGTTLPLTADPAQVNKLILILKNILVAISFPRDKCILFALLQQVTSRKSCGRILRSSVLAKPRQRTASGWLWPTITLLATLWARMPKMFFLLLVVTSLSLALRTMTARKVDCQDSDKINVIVINLSQVYLAKYG